MCDQGLPRICALSRNRDGRMHELRRPSLQRDHSILLACISNRQVSTHLPFTSLNNHGSNSLCPSPRYFSRPDFQNYHHHEAHHLGHLVFAAGTSRDRTPATCHEWSVVIILLRIRTVMPADTTCRADAYKNETLADLLLQMDLWGPSLVSRLSS
jgi:hypothetical protein